MVEQRETMKGKRQELGGVWSLRIHGDRILPLLSEGLVEVKVLSSGWLLCFSDSLNSSISGLLLFMLQLRTTGLEK